MASTSTNPVPQPGAPLRRRSWTRLVGIGLQARISRRARLLSDAAYWNRHSAAIQARQLRRLLLAASPTWMGRKHGFARLARLDDEEMIRGYRAGVPIADWYLYKDQFARMREEGEPDVLWPGLVTDFAQTSGTTAGDKYIPVSRAMLRSNYLASLDIFANLHRFGVSLPELLAGKSLFLGGSTELAQNDRGVRTGDLSGIVTPLIRWPLSEIYLPGPDIALMSHWPAKIEAMARRCLHEDVRMVSGMPSWGLVLFDRLIQLARESGREARTIADVWPNFQVLVHGGVKYTPFEGRMRQMYSGSADGPDIQYRLELYPASEGFVAIQDTRGDPGLRLNTDIGIFYEFVPLEEIAGPAPRSFTCDAVEKGQRYVVVLTTCAGLFRYILGDVVEFDSAPAAGGRKGGDGPARLRIVGRHRHFINAFGENLIVEHIENAVAAAASRAGVLVGEFTAAPVYPRDGVRAGLELAVEVETKTGFPLPTFRESFDQSLKAQNVDYTTKRTDGVGMTEPTITTVPPGTFHRWMQSRGKLGGQHKCPRCSNSREIIEQVVSAAGADHGAVRTGREGVL
ncbi:MAG: GH3 auxin-responsive promoter family protein [Phycisphaerales bacterium]|nr:GH3 auxin-responsive promoter family protein [Phycisphaerales bacterium]